jgi:acyl-coenzyme A synthetase/AMP-(fatty) acid ligase
MESIRNRLADAPDCSQRFLWAVDGAVRLSEVLGGTSLGGEVSALAGKSLLLATRSPLAAALALIELDGVAGRIVIATPDLAADHLPFIASAGSVDVMITESDTTLQSPGVPVVSTTAVVQGFPTAARRHATEWVLLTSGTTGVPKLVVHTFASLAAPIATHQAAPHGTDVVWGTFYDIRRYGGLQILLRALLTGGSLVMTSPEETVPNYLSRLRTHRVTHLSGTPSHWRRAMMTGAAATITPGYVRLSGEIADQGALNALQACYPEARIAHAFASTEAGVAFEVNDGREGFPASVIESGGDVRMKVTDASLRIHSNRNAIRYLGPAQPPIAGADGFIDTGDIVERRGDRYYFLGRRNGVINVGGAKVYPEEVEAAISRHPSVRMVRVRGRISPIVGSLVVADVVLEQAAGDAREDRISSLRQEILGMCRATLAPHKVPATIRVVDDLATAAAGKIVRTNA